MPLCASPESAHSYIEACKHIYAVQPRIALGEWIKAEMPEVVATTPHANEWAERLNNTVRERNKTQRGWKADNTPLREGQRLFYNFIREHQSLEGLIPAEMAGLDAETGQNRWMELLKRTMK